MGQEVVDTASETSVFDDAIGTSIVRRRTSEIEIGEQDARIAVLISFFRSGPGGTVSTL